MAKKTLSTKVEHCPSCGILKSKEKACKHCGYDPAAEIREEQSTSINLKLTGYDMSKYDCVVINGVKYYK